MAEDEGDTLYQSAYSILLSQRLASSQIDIERAKSDFEAAVRCNEVNTPSVESNLNERKSEERWRVTIQEIEDESWLEARLKPKSLKHLLYNVNEERPPNTKHPTSNLEDQSYAKGKEDTTVPNQQTKLGTAELSMVSAGENGHFTSEKEEHVTALATESKE